MTPVAVGPGALGDRPRAATRSRPQNAAAGHRRSAAAPQPAHRVTDAQLRQRRGIDRVPGPRRRGRRVAGWAWTGHDRRHDRSREAPSMSAADLRALLAADHLTHAPGVYDPASTALAVR